MLPKHIIGVVLAVKERKEKRERDGKNAFKNDQFCSITPDLKKRKEKKKRPICSLAEVMLKHIIGVVQSRASHMLLLPYDFK